MDVLIHTCPKEVSWQSVNDRYENMLAKGRIPRYVPKSVHDKVVEVLPRNTDRLSQSKQIASLTVHNRQAKLFDSCTDKELPSLAINKELNRKDKQFNLKERLSLIAERKVEQKSLSPVKTISNGKL